MNIRKTLGRLERSSEASQYDALPCQADSLSCGGHSIPASVGVMLGNGARRASEIHEALIAQKNVKPSAPERNRLHQR